MLKITSMALYLAVFFASPAFSADPTDPDWPCIQRKIPRLSAGVIWPHPIPSEVAPLAADEKELVDMLSLRRITLEEVAVEVAEHQSRTSSQSSADWGRIFNAAFTRIDRNRTQIIHGIERYADKQIGLSREIDELRQKMDAALDASEPDYDLIDAYEVDLDWKTRIFDDRSRALTYVCESPVLLEKRAFAVARLLSEQVDE